MLKKCIMGFKTSFTICQNDKYMKNQRPRGIHFNQYYLIGQFMFDQIALLKLLSAKSPGAELNN